MVGGGFPVHSHHRQLSAHRVLGRAGLGAHWQDAKHGAAPGRLARQPAAPPGLSIWILQKKHDARWLFCRSQDARIWWHSMLRLTR
jgi:hypothetical protein